MDKKRGDIGGGYVDGAGGGGAGAGVEKNWNCTDGVMGKEGWGIKLPCGKGEWEEMFVGAAGEEGEVGEGD